MKKKTRKYLYIGIGIIVIIVLFLVYYFILRDFCKGLNESGCEENPNCEWKSLGGMTQPHYTCCPKLPRKCEFLEEQLHCFPYLPDWMFWYPMRCKEIFD